MKSNKQRISIAEATGLKNIRMKFVNDGAAVLVSDCPEFSGQWAEVPDYLNDLNAMHKAEQSLGTKWMDYSRKILAIATGHEDNMPLGFLNGATLCDAVHASAAIRAEAFLKTLGLWDMDEKK